MAYKTYNIKTTVKKSVLSREFWETQQPSPSMGRKAFSIEELFRWGEVVISVPADDEEFQDLETLRANESGFCPQWYNVEDQNLDDGCALDFLPVSEGGEYEETTVEEIEELWENGGYQAFEEFGYDLDDVEVFFYGPLEIEEVKDV